MHDIVQGRAPAVQGYILWGSVQSRAKGKVQPAIMTFEERCTEVLPCRCNGPGRWSNRMQIRSRYVTCGCDTVELTT